MGRLLEECIAVGVEKGGRGGGKSRMEFTSTKINKGCVVFHVNFKRYVLELCKTNCLTVITAGNYEIRYAELVNILGTSKS